MNHQNVRVAWAGSRRLYDGHFPGEQWEGGGTVIGPQIKHETSLIDLPVVGRTIVNASNKGDRGEERELGTLICPRPRAFCIPSGCSIAVNVPDASEPCFSYPANIYKPTVRNVTVNSLYLTGEYRSPWYDPRIAAPLLTSCFHAFVGRWVKILDQQICCDRDILCGRMTDVTNDHFGPERNTICIIRGKRGGLDAFQFNPGPLSQVHLIELALHNGNLIGERLVATLAGGLHLIKLPTENNVLRDADADCSDGQYGNHPSRSGRAPRSTISGILMVLFGAALMSVPLRLTDAPSNPAWLWASSGFIALVAAAFICQGTVLILTGQWLT